MALSSHASAVIIAADFLTKLYTQPEYKELQQQLVTGLKVLVDEGKL